MKKKLWVLPTVLMVSACAGGMEITQAPVSVSRDAGFSSHNYVGDHPIQVRSYSVSKASNGSEEKTEFSGANCEIKGRGYKASFPTPAIVNLPDYGYLSQAVTGSCRVGDTVRPIVAKPYNITVEQIRSNTGAGGGLLGVVVAGVANSIALAANDPTNDDFGYRPVSVTFPADEVQ